jgi:Bacterial membrane protein YfhO
VKIRVNPWPNFFGAAVAGLIVVIFCLLLLWHDPLLFWNDDYQISILPVFADMARSWSEGHWPLLSPYSWVCGNLAGEFQYGTFSIFINAVVVLIWKFPLTFPQQAAALSITHLFVLAAGAFLLARDRKFSMPLSTFVALVAALSGWIFCWAATDWFGALGAFAWLPWAWWGLERALDRQRTRWRFLWPAPFVYLVVTGGFPYTVGMLAVVIAWLSIKTLAQTKNFMSILPMFFGVALGFGLSAPAWLALLDYVQGSTREAQSGAVHWQWMVPVTALPGFILPCWTVNWADFGSRYLPHTGTELTCGLVAPVALLSFVLRLAIRDSRIVALDSIKKIRWELLLLLLVLLLAILPSAGLFRWSFRWLPFFHLILALCAAEALRLRLRSGVIALVLVVLAAIAMSILHTSGRFAFPLTWILIAIAVFWTAAEFFVGREYVRAWLPASVTFMALLATYLCLPTNGGVPKYNLALDLTKPEPLDPQRLYLSLYSWTEIAYRTHPGVVGRIVRPGSTSLWAGLRFINGYSPILAAGVAREFKSSVHGEIDWSVGKYLLEQQAGPDGELARLGVDGIVVAPEINFQPQPKSEWEVTFANDEGRVFHRSGSRFALVRSDSATISRIVDSRNRVAADVDLANNGRNASVTFSRPYFPGYQARLDGKKLEVSSYRGLFPTVELPPGSHGRLVLTYCPWGLKFGGGLSILSIIVFAVSGVIAFLTLRGPSTPLGMAN